ncbi:MAG: hypothetical protein LBS15_01030 [Endomicrobium sp.]|jgi:hypothetical protein|nr:hypothetical protein [Endomicrobium sp.]
MKTLGDKNVNSASLKNEDVGDKEKKIYENSEKLFINGSSMCVVFLGLL